MNDNLNQTTPDRLQRWLSQAMMVGVCAIAIAYPVEAGNQSFAPSSVYKREAMRQFTILLHPEVFKHPAAVQEMRQELDAQLARISQVLPAKPLAALQRVRIWIEWEKKPNGAAEFHHSANWLRQHGYNPAKAGGVEISNIHNFVQWSRTAQPWMVLHELAHAYHNLVLGSNYAPIASAYQNAIKRGLYQSVPYIQGGHQKAYALTNTQEYFAELSEAYFGKNDFYPFTRAELKTYDPQGYGLMEKAWGTTH